MGNQDATHCIQSRDDFEFWAGVLGRISIVVVVNIVGYDVILGCFDNKYARLWLNNFAVNNKITYIDGGTGPKSGQIAAYIPGESSCIDCQMDLKNYRRENMSCADQPNASVVMSNMVIGSAMVGEAVRAMYSVGTPLQSIIKYNVSFPNRIGLTRGRIVGAHNC